VELGWSWGGAGDEASVGSSMEVVTTFKVHAAIAFF